MTYFSVYYSRNKLNNLDICNRTANEKMAKIKLPTLNIVSMRLDLTLAFVSCFVFYKCRVIILKLTQNTCVCSRTF